MPFRKKQESRTRDNYYNSSVIIPVIVTVTVIFIHEYMDVLGFVNCVCVCVCVCGWMDR